jgi:hypothetical protein
VPLILHSRSPCPKKDFRGDGVENLENAIAGYEAALTVSTRAALPPDFTVAGPLKRLLIECKEGNPFFLEESVRTPIESCVLAGHAAYWRSRRRR